MTQLCPTLGNPWAVSSVHKDFPGKNTGVGNHSLLPGDFPDPRIEPESSALQADSVEPSGMPQGGPRRLL